MDLSQIEELRKAVLARCKSRVDAGEKIEPEPEEGITSRLKKKHL